MHFNLSVPTCARAFGKNQQTLSAFEHGIDFFQHFHAFIVGDVAGSDNLAFHAGVVQQVFFNQYVRLGIVADQQDNIQKRGMVGKNELAGPAEFFQAVETDAQYARPLQVADKETPNFAYHASCFKLALDVAFGGLERIGQKCDFEQYACNAEEDEAEECGKKATEIV